MVLKQQGWSGPAATQANIEKLTEIGAGHGNSQLAAMMQSQLIWEHRVDMNIA